MSTKTGNMVIAFIVVVSIIATVVVAVLATHGATGYVPNPHAWFYTLIIPVFLMLIVTAYYNEQEAY
ncbi:MAG: hypothetical protein ACYCXG_04705 [Acidiferrobacter sp.]